MFLVQEALPERAVDPAESESADEVASHFGRLVELLQHPYEDARGNLVLGGKARAVIDAKVFLAKA